VETWDRTSYASKSVGKIASVPWPCQDDATTQLAEGARSEFTECIGWMDGRVQ